MSKDKAAVDLWTGHSHGHCLNCQQEKKRKKKKGLGDLLCDENRILNWLEDIISERKTFMKNETVEGKAQTF